MFASLPPHVLRVRTLLLTLSALFVGGVWLVSPLHADAAESSPSSAAKAALSVQLIQPRQEAWPLLLPANGSVMAWQEAVIAPELASYRITEVAVQVGDRVRKGQLLARLDSDTASSEAAAARAEVAEQQASVAEAQANAGRANELRAKGFYSAQLHKQYLTAEQTARAKLAAAEARLQSAELRLGRTRIVAPDDGVISASSAAVGSLSQIGGELFRLIRGGRLEWRAEVPAADLGRLQAGAPADLEAPAGEVVRGRVRVVAPSVNMNTRNGLVYVDLPAASPLRAGMFARGTFELARRPALTLPQSALVLREGFAYVFRLEGESRVAQTKVALGRRQADRVEIVEGLAEGARVVASGAGFLADGDLVTVVPGGSK